MTLTQLLQKIGEEASATALSIVAGHCDSFEDYRGRVARVRAFQDVIEMATVQEPKRTESESA